MKKIWFIGMLLPALLHSADNSQEDKALSPLSSFHPEVTVHHTQLAQMRRIPNDIEPLSNFPAWIITKGNKKH